MRKIQDSKIREKQRRTEELQVRIAIQEQDLLTKDMAKTLRKANVMDTYEKVCHLGGY